MLIEGPVQIARYALKSSATLEHFRPVQIARCAEELCRNSFKFFHSFYTQNGCLVSQPSHVKGRLQRCAPHASQSFMSGWFTKVHSGHVQPSSGGGLRLPEGWGGGATPSAAEGWGGGGSAAAAEGWGGEG